MFPIISQVFWTQRLSYVRHICWWSELSKKALQKHSIVMLGFIVMDIMCPWHAWIWPQIRLSAHASKLPAVVCLSRRYVRTFSIRDVTNEVVVKLWTTNGYWFVTCSNFQKRAFCFRLQWEGAVQYASLSSLSHCLQIELALTEYEGFYWEKNQYKLSHKKFQPPWSREAVV